MILTEMADAAIMLLLRGVNVMSVKRITIRVSPELHAQLTEVAAERHVSLNQLAIEALEAYVLNRAAEQGRLPLRELSALLAPAALAKSSKSTL